MAEPRDRSFGVKWSDQVAIVRHKTRVRDASGASGVVIGVQNARRRLLGIGMRVDQPAKLIVILDSGRQVEWLLTDVEVVA